MRNLVKTIKTLFIISFSAVVASCSSGGTGTIEGFSLTGDWQGVVFETTDVAFDVLMNIAQDETLGITGGPESTTITWSITFLSTSDPNVQPCIGTLAGETATLTFNASNPIIAGDGFSASASTNTINGQLVVEGDDTACGGPLNLVRVS